MSIELTPKHQRIVDEAIRSGAYTDADQVIERALDALNSQDEWLRAQSGSIHEKISRGLAQLDRGEGITGDESRARLGRRKAGFPGYSVPSQ